MAEALLSCRPGFAPVAPRPLAAWADALGLAHATVAVNVSARQFRQPNFADRVLAVLDRNTAKPPRS